MKYLISYADEKFREGQKILEESAYKHGFDKVISYSPEKIADTDFYKENIHILSQSRGAGYWLWKPYIIYKNLCELGDSDYLIYSDAGAMVINNLNPLFDICDKEDGLVLFDNCPHINKTYTRRDCFILMDCDEEKYHNGPQITASFVVCKKTKKSLQIIKEWLFYCKNEKILTDIESESPNFPEFIDHRHDQSILSILAIKHGLTLYRDPSQWGDSRKYNHEDSYYDTLFYHHRNDLKIAKYYLTGGIK